MMKRSTLILLVLFFILGGATLWYLFKESSGGASTLGADRAFAVADTTAIHKIFLADREGERVTLERKDGYWLYNGKWKARPTAVRNLLDAVSRVQMLYVPPRAMVDNMVRVLATRGIKVELYGRNGDILKTYYVGGATPDERGTFMMLEGAEQPYVVGIPEWEGNVFFRYNLKGEDWRDRAVFSEDPNRITSVTVEYPKQRNKSFRLEKVDNSFRIEPLFPTTAVIDKPYRKGSAETFLVAFEQLGAEAFENKNSRRDSIRQLIPFSIITVRNDAGEEKWVRLHPILPPGAALDIKTGLPTRGGTIERYFADCSSGDFMLVQDRVFRRILWAYEFFFTNPPEE